MKRPSLIHFKAIKNYKDISVKAFVSNNFDPLSDIKIPIKSIALIKSHAFAIKLIGLNDNRDIIFQKEYETDSFGVIDIKIGLNQTTQEIDVFEVYETSTVEGLNFMLGTFYISDVTRTGKVIISDFDKTLCDTKFSSIREIYESLNTSLSDFPAVKVSLDFVLNKIDEGYKPFVLSASPHFYERAISDWLYQNKLYSSHIFLKDYRDFFSFDRGLLSFKDVKKQGFYKLNQLVKILSMTNLPDELILVGDGFEADTLIYLTIYAILIDKQDPWQVWNKLKNNNVFSLTQKQHSLFLSKFYQLSEETKNKRINKLEIHIRCNELIIEQVKKKKYDIDFIDKNLEKVTFYIA